jgi:hypothetical protein
MLIFMVLVSRESVIFFFENRPITDSEFELPCRLPENVETL